MKTKKIPADVENCIRGLFELYDTDEPHTGARTSDERWHDETTRRALLGGNGRLGRRDVSGDAGGCGAVRLGRRCPSPGACLWTAGEEGNK